MEGGPASPADRLLLRLEASRTDLEGAQGLDEYKWRRSSRASACTWRPLKSAWLEYRERDSGFRGKSGAVPYLDQLMRRL